VSFAVEPGGQFHSTRLVLDSQSVSRIQRRLDMCRVLIASPGLISRGVRASIQQFLSDLPGVTVPSLQIGTLISRRFFLGKNVV
jgi:hypothetical protein